jgi:CheY-like chemotaxis protein
MAAKNKNVKRLLIIDDHPMMRTGLAQLIDHEGDLKVCAEADNAGQAIDLVAKQKFDLALCDISLPDRNGLELIKDLRALKPELPILVVSMHDEMIYAERVLRAGGRGYIMKQEGGEKSGRCWRGRFTSAKKCPRASWKFFPGARRNRKIRRSRNFLTASLKFSSSSARAKARAKSRSTFI